MRYFSSPYVSVAERLSLGREAAAKLSKKSGRAAAPVVIEGRAIAKSFWGCAWCNHLEAFSDYANRLPRGRTYARNGSIVDLFVAPGQVTALVQGSSLYKIDIRFQPMKAERWQAFKQRSAGQVTNLIDLLQGKLSKEILADVTRLETGLFPAPSEIKMTCSCPDWAGLCKHLAAVLYGVGSRLDHQPELLFVLRGVEVAELIASATASAAAGPLTGETQTAADSALAGEDLSALFGVDLDDGSGREPKSELSQAAVAAPTANSTRMPQPKSSAAAGKTPAQPPRRNTRGPTTPTRAKGKNSVAKRSATPPAPDAPNPKPAPTVKAKQAKIKRAKPKQAKTKQAKAAPRSKTGSKA
jgi:uncharacterized Zn finger protein